MAQYLVGIDAGTTGCKTCVFDVAGTVIASDYREYPCYYPAPGWVEQTNEDLMPPLFDSCKAAVTQSGVDPRDIVALAISTQGSIIGLLDSDGQLLRPWVGWQDVRGVEYIDRLQEQISRERYYEITGDPLGTVFSSTKLAWLRDNEPENWKNTALFSTEQDYVLREWGAREYWTDLSSASREGTADVNNNAWSPEIHDLLGIPLSKRAQIATEPGQVVARLSADVAARSGLAEGTLLCVGAHDQNCSTFGAGAVDAGDTVMVIGTFGSCFVVLDRPVRDPHGKLVVKPNHGIGNWTIEAFSATSASAFRWYRDTFADLEVAAARSLREDPYDLITRAISTVPPGSDGITFLPFLQGASGARINGNARGTFVGMTLGTSKANMARAVLEGICFEMKDILNAQAAAGIEIGTIRLTGGAAKSPLWCQMLADVFGHPIELLQTSETGCLGAALYAGVGAGIYSDCRDAAAKAVKVTQRYEPDASVRGPYDAAFGKFVEVYEALNGRVF
jgi:xylulokinase